MLLFIVQDKRLFRSSYGPMKKGEITVRFNCSRNWDDLKKIAVFGFNGTERAVPLDESNSCIVPENAVKGGEFRVHLAGITADFEQRLISNESIVKVI